MPGILAFPEAEVTFYWASKAKKRVCQIERWAGHGTPVKSHSLGKGWESLAAHSCLCLTPESSLLPRPVTQVLATLS